MPGYFLKSALPVAAGAIGLALAMNLAPPSELGAAEADTISLNYGIYMGGARVYAISYSASLSSDGYRTSVTMASKGLGKVFSDFRLKMATSGSISSGQPEPQDFMMESSKKDERKKVAMTWEPNGVPKTDRSFKMPEKRAAAVAKALKPEMPDPLTAVLRHALDENSNFCSETLRAYNGAEIYELKLTFLGDDVIRNKGKGVYTGPAHKCRAIFVPIAGYSDNRMRKLLKDPPSYTLWFAEVKSPATATRFLVPVQAQGKASGHTFAIFASEAQMSGRPLSALSALE
ncbi:MAG: DUF3108 domain-containing protein [Aestuariivirgaceae bacterium]